MDCIGIADGDPSDCSGNGYHCLVPFNYCNCYDGYTGKIQSRIKLQNFLIVEVSTTSTDYSE